LPYTVEIEKTFRAVQGLTSPVREQKGLPALVGDDGFAVTLRVGISFDDDQLKETGWFVDTDAVEGIVQGCAKYLESAPWTSLFDFRPTFELVSREMFGRMSNEIEQLSFVQLENSTIGVMTRFRRAATEA
jgi:hypothetical protein